MKFKYDTLKYINSLKDWNYYCIEKNCNKRISRRAKRCGSCQCKTKIGNKNPNFGKTHKGLNAGKKNPMYGKPTPHGIWTKYKKINFRSGWEANFAKWCDLSNIKWEYESKTFDLGNTTYTPDFYLPEFDCYIEIKGYWRDDAIKKYKLFCKKYRNINLKIVSQLELKKLSILN